MATSGWSVELDDVRLQMQFGIQREQVFRSCNVSATWWVLHHLKLLYKHRLWDVEMMHFMQKILHATLLVVQTSQLKSLLLAFEKTLIFSSEQS